VQIKCTPFELEAQKSADNNSLAVKLIRVGNQLNERNIKALATLPGIEIRTAWLSTRKEGKEPQDRKSSNAPDLPRNMQGGVHMRSFLWVIERSARYTFDGLTSKVSFDR